MLFNPFKLKSTLARNASADPDDTIKMKKVLGSLGYYKSTDNGMNRYPDERMFKGIERFQSDFGLKKDGVMRPDGETVEVLGNLSRRPGVPAIGELLSTSKKRWWDGGIPATPSLRPAYPGAKPATPSLLPARPGEFPADPALFRTDTAGPPAVSGEVVSSNARTVTAARKSGDHSGLARLHARAVTDFGDKALAEVADFDSQLKSADPSAHKSWRIAFSDQAPEAEKRLRLMNETGEPDSPPPASPITPGNKAPAIPADKKDWFKGREQEWDNFHEAIGKLPDISANERAAYMHIFAREGGMVKDKSGTAASGIRQETADRFLGKGDLKHLPVGTPPDKLPAQARASIYRKYMDEQFPKIGGHKVLGQIPDAKGAAALADGMFRLGHEDAAKAVQNAMIRVDPNLSDKSGVFGSQSLANYKKQLANPDTRNRLLNAVADEYSKKIANEASRFDSLRP